MVVAIYQAIRFCLEPPSAAGDPIDAVISVLESIIIPFPVDPLDSRGSSKAKPLVRIAFSCSIASVTGAVGWALGAYLVCTSMH